MSTTTRVKKNLPREAILMRKGAIRRKISTNQCPFNVQKLTDFITFVHQIYD